MADQGTRITLPVRIASATLRERASTKGGAQPSNRLAVSLALLSGLAFVAGVLGARQ